MRYAYPCSIVRDEEEARATTYIVTFPDVYSGAWSWDDAVDMAKDCLEVALGMYVKAREDIPVPSPMAEGQVLICRIAVALYTAMREEHAGGGASASQHESSTSPRVGIVFSLAGIPSDSIRNRSPARRSWCQAHGQYGLKPKRSPAFVLARSQRGS